MQDDSTRKAPSGEPAHSAPSVMERARGSIHGIVDVNVSLSHWPSRRVPHDDTPGLVAKLRQSNVARAWAGSFDGLLHRDIAAVNTRLARDCQQNGGGFLVPFGSVNPMLPDWQDDLRRCQEEHHMPGIRLHPNYHGYTLDNPAFAELLRLAEARELIVQLAVKMEDERTQHPLLQVPSVDMKPLPALIAQRSKLQLVILNGLRTLRGSSLTQLAAAGQVSFEISMLEGVGGIAKLLDVLPLERVLFGSHFPFFCFESAVLKMWESSLSDFHLAAISNKNARRLLPNAAEK